jgi:NAD(P)-dependent dehydrogenase (short-subunit alcohol dehydrogenase family)
MVTISELSTLKGKAAVITGGAGHLGRAMAETFAELGADLFLVDREAAALQAVCGEISERWKIKASPVVCDLESQDSRQLAVRDISKAARSVDILVNNAALVGTSDLQGWGVAFDKQSTETWRRAIEVNLTAAFDLVRDLQPALKTAKGSIINISSIYGVYGTDWRLYAGTSMASPGAYSASKGGLIQFSRWLSTTLAPDIRVNVISPGGVFRQQPQSFVDAYVSRTPLGRMMNETDIKGAAAYLGTNLSAYVTGQNIVIDGGWGVW